MFDSKVLRAIILFFYYFNTLFIHNSCRKSRLQDLIIFQQDATYSVYYISGILFVVLYGCETWSLTLREERKLRVYENMVLRRIFGPRRDKVMGEWRRLHNEELNDLYSSPNIVRVIKS